MDSPCPKAPGVRSARRRDRRGARCEFPARYRRLVTLVEARSAFRCHMLQRREKHMGVLTQDMRDILASAILAFVATVRRDGSPSLSPKASTIPYDDDHLLFVDMA